MAATRVYTTHAPYRQVLAQLGLSAVAVPTPAGAVHAVTGVGWPLALASAVEAGAAAVLIDDPGPAGAADLTALRDSPVRVVFDRGRLRPDVVAEALAARGEAPARVVVIECVGHPADVAGLLVDGVGWARVLAGGDLSLRSAHSTKASTLALLDGPGALPVTISVTRLLPNARGGLIRASALGETRSEITVDLVAGSTSVETAGAQGVTRSPSRFESSHRLALRRAIAVATSHDEPDDRIGFCHDALLADLITREAHHSG